jgi:large subunit ribosomal protein L23
MKSPQQILLRPLMSEKTVAMASSANVVSFEVAAAANKIEIRKAVEDLFGVRVETVRTLIVRGKSKRWGRFMGKRKNWKKAYVTLAEGDSINFFEGV